MQANNKKTRPDSVCQFAKQRRKGEKARREREKDDFLNRNNFNERDLNKDS